ncbi:hypothetical protein RFI_15770 [Reticulomyxa filosa]|uniref:Uncharacterized protein n=1 Tax=Reticulomyxa filosa TaxID=46433 RepID=X6N695_RETFI|nr:hypothetical protein RFI_15770 [Reticulomyxa filosa]|eukprot:ETO21433.1 hypothetical protein RFI_15770 [Reticulomyxa filosa]
MTTLSLPLGVNTTSEESDGGEFPALDRKDTTIVHEEPVQEKESQPISHKSALSIEYIGSPQNPNAQMSTSPENSAVPSNICRKVQQMILEISKKEACETPNEFQKLKRELKLKLQMLKKMEELSQAFVRIPKLQNELSRDPSHGYMNHNAALAVLQEMFFISKQTHSFGLLLLQCDGTTKVLDDLGPEHANEFIRQIADRIGDELTIQHITFALHKYKIAILCYVTGI